MTADSQLIFAVSFIEGDNTQARLIGRAGPGMRGMSIMIVSTEFRICHNALALSSSDLHSDD